MGEGGSAFSFRVMRRCAREEDALVDLLEERVALETATSLEEAVDLLCERNTGRQ